MKKILFQIEINGSDVALKNATDLRAAISNIEKQLKQTADDAAYERLEKQSLELKAALQDVNKENQRFIKDLQASKTGEGSYVRLSNQLNELRRQFRDLSKAEREGAVGQQLLKDIQLLDKELKDIDASLGQFQRNVGNYPKEIKAVFDSVTGSIKGVLPGFEGLGGSLQGLVTGFQNVGQSATAMGNALNRSFILFQIATVIIEATKAVQAFVKETREARQEVLQSGEAFESLDTATAKLQATAETFGKEFSETLTNAKDISRALGISIEESTDILQKALLAGKEVNDEFVESLKDGTIAVADLRIESNEFTRTQQEQLKVQEELFAAQNELTTSVDALGIGYGGLADQVQTFVIKALAGLVDGIGKAQSALLGLGAAGQAVVDDIRNSFQRLVIDSQILVEQLRALNPFASESEQDRIGNALFALRQQRKQFEGAGKSLSDAFIDAYEANEKRRAEIAADVRRDREAKQNKKDQEAAAKAAAELAKKAAEARAKAIAEADKSEEALNKKRLALLANLGAKIVDLTVQNIKDAERREIESERVRFERVKAELQKQETERIADVEATRKALVAAYGEGSRQVLEFEKRTGQELIEIQAKNNQIIQQEEQAHRNKLIEIQKQFTESKAAQEAAQTKRELDALAKRYADIEKEEKTRVNNLITSILQDASIDPNERNALVLGLKFEADVNALERQRIAITDQIKAIEAELEAIETGDIEAVSAEQYGALLDQLTDYALKKSEIERDIADKAIQESQRATEKQLENAAKVLQNVQQGFALLTGFISAQAERQAQAVDANIEKTTQSIQDLEARLEQSTGRQKIALQARIDQERKGLEALAKQKEKLEKEEVQRRKRFAVIDSIIQTALAVVSALKTPPSPNIPAAITAGAFGAAQTALIVAQPAATGGVIGGVKNQGDGLVVAAPNIPTMRNGDNVLATIKRGEVVLNKRQQAALGGASTFRAIGVPGFAEGGIAGAVLPSPALPTPAAVERIEAVEKLAAKIAEAISAINARIDRLQVFVVSEDVRDDLVERDALQAKATFEL